MQSSTNQVDQLNISLGERRGKSDLARFSLDLSWARAVPDGAQSWAYPSPPMSGSPPLPPRHNLDSSDRGHGSYGSTGNVFRDARIPQQGHFDQMRGVPLRNYQPEPQLSYPQYQMEDMSTQYQYQQPRAPMASHQHPHSLYATQQVVPYSAPERPSIGEVSGYTSPKSQRKTKGHVASACVPCKRAHLRCDAQRPCSRCLSNGKEDTCVDVKHKKRGRPRLRDERDSTRYEGTGSNYAPPADTMRRPLSMFSAGDVSISTPYSDAQRNNGYRVLKSQGGTPMGHSMVPTPINTNLYGEAMSTNQRMTSYEPACAFLTMEMQIAKTTQAFSGVVGAHSVVGRKLHDIVSVNDRDKIYRLQRGFEDERRSRDPSYLPPIFSKEEEDRVIQSLTFSPSEIGQLRTDRGEVFTFQTADGQQRGFHVQLGLAKKDSIYFVLLMVHIPTTPQAYQQSSSSPYSRESASRDSTYGFQTPSQLSYASQTPGTSPFMSNPSFGSDMLAYRTPGPLGQNVAMANNTPSYPQHQARPEYPQAQMNYQPPMGEVLSGPPQAQPQPQPQAQTQRASDLQLPPIRGPTLVVDARVQGDRSGRVDIGGLLQNPDASRRMK